MGLAEHAVLAQGHSIVPPSFGVFRFLHSPGSRSAAGVFSVFCTGGVTQFAIDTHRLRGFVPYQLGPAVPRRQPISTNPHMISIKPASASMQWSAMTAAPLNRVKSINRLSAPGALPVVIWRLEAYLLPWQQHNMAE
jgi:hypothetical protein